MKKKVHEYVLSEQRILYGNNPEVQKVVGPVHVNTASSLTSDYICNRYGGCPMLLCSCYLPPEDERESLFDDEISWFRGSCDYCWRRIRRKAHAVRLPLIDGSWKGCYCSFICIQNDIPNLYPETIVNPLLLISSKLLKRK